MAKDRPRCKHGNSLVAYRGCVHCVERAIQGKRLLDALDMYAADVFIVLQAYALQAFPDGPVSNDKVVLHAVELIEQHKKHAG